MTRFPTISKAFSESVYLTLSTVELNLLEKDRLEALLAYLSSKDWLHLNIGKLEEQKAEFERYFN